jgi:hypothetical protein
VTCVLDLEGIAPGITRGFCSLHFPTLLSYDAYVAVAFAFASAPVSSPDAPTHGFFVSSSSTRPSGSLTPSVVAFFAFSA